MSKIWTDLHSRVHQTIKQQALLSPQAKLLIAVSGGQDSLCLLKLLFDLQSKWQWQLAIAHCDHQWSYDQGIADHVAAIAKRCKQHEVVQEPNQNCKREIEPGIQQDWDPHQSH